MKLGSILELKYSISVLRELPNEVLAEIFLYLVTDYDWEPGTVGRPIDLALAPQNISQVCSKWREVALSTPNLWSNMQIKISPTDGQDLDILTQKLLIFLSRSGQYPLSLNFLVDHQGEFKPTSLRLSDVLTPYAMRLQHISLSLAESLDHIIDIPGGLMRSLESLALSYSTFTFDSDPPINIPPLVITPLDSPTLTHVTIQGAKLSILLPNFLQLQWAQLTNLYLVDMVTSHAVGHGILRLCHRLRSCAFEIAVDLMAPPVLEPNIVLMHLETIHLKGSHMNQYGRFFQPIVAPSLKVLSIDLAHGGAPSEQGLASFLPRSACGVERFTINVPIHEMFGPLQAMPSLTHLISDGGVDSATLKVISDGQLLPKLEALVCDGISNFESLVEMLECRSWHTKADDHPNIALKTFKSVVYGVTDGHVSAACQNRLQKLQADGMYVRDEKNMTATSNRMHSHIYTTYRKSEGIPYYFQW